MSLTSLPNEIQHEILSYIRDDTDALKLVSSVSKIFRDIAQGYLFRSLTFKDSYAKALRRLKYIKRRRHLAKHVRVITLRSGVSQHSDVSKEGYLRFVADMNRQANILIEGLVAFLSKNKETVRDISFIVPCVHEPSDAFKTKQTRRMDDVVLLLGCQIMPRLSSLSLPISSFYWFSLLCEGKFASKISETLKNTFKSENVTTNLKGIKQLSVTFIERKAAFLELSPLVNFIQERTPSLTGLDISFPFMSSHQPEWIGTTYVNNDAKDFPVVDVTRIGCLYHNLTSLSLSRALVYGLDILLEACTKITSLSFAHLSNRTKDGKTESWDRVFKQCAELPLTHLHLDKVGSSVYACRQMEPVPLASYDESDAGSCQKLIHHVLARGVIVTQGPEKVKVTRPDDVRWCRHRRQGQREECLGMLF